LRLTEEGAQKIAQDKNRTWALDCWDPAGDAEAARDHRPDQKTRQTMLTTSTSYLTIT